MKKLGSIFLSLLLAFSLISMNIVDIKAEENEVETIDISNATIEQIEDQIYTGEAITPDVVVTYEDTTLVKDEDYEVSYTDNTNVGEATVTITGKNNYTGTKDITFNIIGKEITVDGITLDTSTYVYDGTEKCPNVSVEGYTSEDYDVTYEDNIYPGTAKAIITYKGNYTGQQSVSYTITMPKAKISKLVSKNKKINVYIKQLSGVDGYRIQYSRSSKFKNYKTVYVSSSAKYKAIKKLKYGKKYYVRVQAYVVVNGKKVYGEYSKKKHIYTNQPTKLKLNWSKKTVHFGKHTYKIKVKSTGYSWTSKKVTYSSSNKKVATVTKKGVIKPIETGTCYITVKTINGIKKKIKVTVKAKVVWVKGKKITVKNEIVERALELVGAYGSCTSIAEKCLNAAGISAKRGNYLNCSSFLHLGKRVSYKNAEPGDIIYYANGGLGCSHVAVYLGNGLSLQGNFAGKATIWSVYIPGGSTPIFIHVPK